MEDRESDLSFEYVEYGKLNILGENTNRVPDWIDILKTDSIQPGSVFSRYIKANTFSSNLGKFSFGLIKFGSSDDNYIFVAIQQRNESEISQRGARPFQHQRFTMLSGQKIVKSFRNFFAVYSTLASIFRINSNSEYEYQFPERTESIAVNGFNPDPQISSVLKLHEASNENLFFWLAENRWIQQLAMWLGKIVRKQRVVIYYKVGDPNMTLTRRLQICEALQLFLQAYPDHQILTFSLDPFTERKTDVTFVEITDRTKKKDYHLITNDTFYKRIEKCIENFFPKKEYITETDYRDFELAIHRWNKAALYLLSEEEKNLYILAYRSFKGLYTVSGIIDGLSKLFENLKLDNLQTRWQSLVKETLFHLDDWLHPNRNYNINKIALRLLEKDFMQSPSLSSWLVNLYWDVLDSIEPQGLSDYLGILEGVDINLKDDLSRLDEIIERTKSEIRPLSGELPGEIPSEWRRFIIDLIVKHNPENLIENMRKQSDQWYDEYLESLYDNDDVDNSQLENLPDQNFERYILKRSDDEWFYKRDKAHLNRFRQLMSDKVTSDYEEDYFEKFLLTSRALFESIKEQDNISPIRNRLLNKLYSYCLDHQKQSDQTHLLICEFPLARSDSNYQEKLLKSRKLPDLSHVFNVDVQDKTIQQVIFSLHSYLKNDKEAFLYFFENVISIYINKLSKPVHPADLTLFSENVSFTQEFLKKLARLVNQEQQEITDPETAIDLIKNSVNKLNSEISADFINNILNKFNKEKKIEFIIKNTEAEWAQVLRVIISKKHLKISQHLPLIPDDFLGKVLEYYNDRQDLKHYVQNSRVCRYLYEKNLLTFEHLKEHLDSEMMKYILQSESLHAVHERALDAYDRQGESYTLLIESLDNETILNFIYKYLDKKDNAAGRSLIFRQIGNNMPMSEVINHLNETPDDIKSLELEKILEAILEVKVKENEKITRKMVKYLKEKDIDKLKTIYNHSHIDPQVKNLIWEEDRFVDFFRYVRSIVDEDTKYYYIVLTIFFSTVVLALLMMWLFVEWV